MTGAAGRASGRTATGSPASTSWPRPALGPGDRRRGAVPGRTAARHPVLHPAEEAAATALCDRLLGQDERADGCRSSAMIDARLAEQQTDGWRYEDMPEDGQAWRDTLPASTTTARTAAPTGSRGPAPEEQQAVLIQAVQDLGAEGVARPARRARVEPVDPVRLHRVLRPPVAWNEIGFPGPAYPRGYKNAGVDAREPFEVGDARPATTRRGRTLMTSGARPQRVGLAAAQRRHPDQPPAARRHAPVRRHRRGRPGRRRLRRRRLDAAAAAGPARAGRSSALDAGPFWDPDTDWVSDEAGSHHLYWTEPRVISGADPVPLGSNNSGRGVGGSMVHYAGYTPRFHPSDFETFTRDGVGADWPIGYADLRPYYAGHRGGAAGRRRGLAVGRPALLPAPPAPGRRQRRDLPARRVRGRHHRQGRARWRSSNGRFGNRPHCIYRGFCLQGCKVNAKASPLITHIPDALAHGAEVRADSMVTRIEVDERTGRATGVHYVRDGVPRFQRARLVAVAGYSIETPRLLLNSASQPVPRRPVQRLRPGRPLPDGAGRAADRRAGSTPRCGCTSRRRRRSAARSSTRPTRPSRTSAGSPSRPSPRCRSPGPSTSPPRATGAPSCAST